MSTMLKLAGLLNVFTVALLPVTLSGPIQSPTTPLISSPMAAAKALAESTVDSNGCAKEPPVTGYAHWYDARDIDGDAVLDEESDTEAVATWVDKGSAGKDLSQGTAGLQPRVLTSCNGFSGSRCVDFPAADDFISAATASDWDFLSDDSTDYTFIAAAVDQNSTYSGTLLCTKDNCDSSGGNGVMIGFSDTGSVNGFVSSSVGTRQHNLRTQYGPADGQSHVYGIQYSASGNNFFHHLRGKQVGATSGSATSQVAACAAIVGKSSSGSDCSATGAGFIGHVHQILIYKTALTEAQRIEVSDWMGCLQHAGTKPTTDSNGCDSEPPVDGYSMWLDGRDVEGSGWVNSQTDATSVAAWVSKWDSSVSTTGIEPVDQSTAGARPTLDDDCVATDGPWCVYFDGGDSLAGNTASNWDFLNNGNDQTVFLVMNTSSSGATYGALDSGPSGGDEGITVQVEDDVLFRFRREDPLASNVVVVADTSTPDLTNVIYATITVDADTEAKLYIDGSLITTDSSVAAADINAGSVAPLRIGGYHGGGSLMTGNIQQIIVYDSLLSSGDISSVETWLGCLRGD